jgi:hypothetical protein
VRIAALHRSLRPTARKASSAWSSLKQRCDHPDPDILHAHPQSPEAQRGAAWHNKGMSRADENHRACILDRGGGSGRASAMPCPDRQMAGPPPPLGLACTHAAWHWQAYRVGQWPPRPCIHSRRVSSARVIPWQFRFFFLVLQHVTGPATLVSTSGVCSPSLCVLRIPNCEYSEYPTAGAPAPPPPTVQAESDVRTPPHTAGASTHSTLGST